MGRKDQLILLINQIARTGESALTQEVIYAEDAVSTDASIKRKKFKSKPQVIVDVDGLEFPNMRFSGARVFAIEDKDLLQESVNSLKNQVLRLIDLVETLPPQNIDEIFSIVLNMVNSTYWIAGFTMFTDGTEKFLKDVILGRQARNARNSSHDRVERLRGVIAELQNDGMKLTKGIKCADKIRPKVIARLKIASNEAGWPSSGTIQRAITDILNQNNTK